MIAPHHLDLAAGAFLERVAPPAAPRSFAAVLGEFRVPDGPHGPRPERPDGDPFTPTPGQRRLLWALNNPEIRTVVALKPVQSGYTTTVGIWCAWVLGELRASTIYALPTRQLHDIVWRSKIRPVLRQFRAGALLPVIGPGSDDGVPVDVHMRSGAHFVMLSSGGKSEAGQAAATVAVVVIDEYDSMRPRMRKLLERRNRMYRGRGKTAIFSTIKHDEKSPTLELYGMGWQERPHCACIACGRRQVWDWEQVRADWSSVAAARATVRIVCRYCQHPHSPAEHHATLAEPLYLAASQTLDEHGRILGEPPQGGLYSLREDCLSSPLFTWDEIVEEHCEAREALNRYGDHEPLRQFHRDYLVRGYSDGERALRVREVELAARSAAAPYELGLAPGYDDAEISVCAIDVQKRRLYWQVMAFGVDDHRWWIIDEGVLAICGDREEPTAEQRWAGYDLIEQRVLEGYVRPDGQLLKPQLGGIDISDGHTMDESLAWMQQHPGWVPVSGQTAKLFANANAGGSAIYRLTGWLAIYRHAASNPAFDRYAVQVDSVKGQVIRALRRGPGDPGAGMLPRGYAADSPLVRQLCSEELQETASGPKWVKIHERNDQFDLATYNLALARYAAELHRAQHESAAAYGVVGTALAG